MQVILFVDDKTVSKGMVKYATAIPRESIVDVTGEVHAPETPVAGCTFSQARPCRFNNFAHALCGFRTALLESTNVRRDDLPNRPASNAYGTLADEGPVSGADECQSGCCMLTPRACLLQVELKVRSIRCVSRADNLPFELADAMRSEEELQREDAQFATVTQDTRLENRWIDLRTPVNQAIFKIQSAVCQVCTASPSHCLPARTLLALQPELPRYRHLQP